MTDPIMVNGHDYERINIVKYLENNQGYDPQKNKVDTKNPTFKL